MLEVIVHPLSVEAEARSRLARHFVQEAPHGAEVRLLIVPVVVHRGEADGAVVRAPTSQVHPAKALCLVAAVGLAEALVLTNPVLRQGQVGLVETLILAGVRILAP